MSTGSQGSDATVYVAIELSKKSWVVAIMHPTKGRPSRSSVYYLPRPVLPTIWR